MGKRYSGRRPEDQPAYVRPEMLDFDKRRMLVTSIPATVQNIINNYISTSGDWILDGGSATISVTNSITLIYDCGGA